MRVITILLSSLIASFCLAASPDKLIVHEWGTFTSLQDSQGITIGGITSDDEPLPQFVHDLLRGRSDPLDSKGIPRGAHNEVTMRLETPVMYFHLPSGAKPITVDVSVQFLGGLLSQFYPDAATNVPNAKSIPFINDKTLGVLKWTGVRVGTNAAGPKTDSHVWLAPRAVDAVDITASNGESERYLFYRGVGHIDAPIRVYRNKDALDLYSQLDPASNVGALRIDKLWLYEMRADGRCAFRAVDPITLQPQAARKGADRPAQLSGIIMPPGFTEQDFSGDNLLKLRQQMHAALVSDGLFDDEATAMLNTWDRSYFKSPGLRLLYLVPQTWTDRYLPLKLSVPAEVTRVMVGRLEMISSEQHAALRQLAEIPNVSSQLKRSWDLYTSLGRFRQAIVRQENRTRPTPGLTQFVNLYGL